jgi:hypothetical protein
MTLNCIYHDFGFILFLIYLNLFEIKSFVVLLFAVVKAVLNYVFI